MNVAPQPAFVGLRGTDDGMACAVEMLGCVFVLRGIAAAHVTAFEASAQVYPRVAHGNALRAHMCLGANVFRVGEVFAELHGSLLRFRAKQLRQLVKEIHRFGDIKSDAIKSDADEVDASPRMRR